MGYIYEDSSIENEDSLIQNEVFALKMMIWGDQVRAATNCALENDEFCIKIDEFCLENDDLGRPGQP